MTDTWDIRAADAWERHLAWGRGDRIEGDDEQDEVVCDDPSWWDEEDAR